MTKAYSLAFRLKMVERLTGKNALSSSQLGREMGIRQQNLSRWLHQARSLPSVASNTPKARIWTVEQKAQALAGESKLSGEELTSHLEREGIKLADFGRWRIALEEDGQGLSRPPSAAASSSESSQREGPGGGYGSARAKKNDRQLLQGRGRRHRRAEREVVLIAIDQAQAGGARLAQTCQMVGISARTIERWHDHPQGEDARHGPHHRPHNDLSPAEESQVMSVGRLRGF
jgi:transposase-like protein